MSYKDTMKFVDSHEWVNLVSDNDVLVGITDHAQGLLGDLVYIELPKIGTKISKKQVIGAVESVKAASDLYSPVSGEVIGVNQDALANPSVLNTDPHNEGWLLKVKLDNTDQLELLLSLDEYKKIIG